MTLADLKQIIDWMAASPIAELELVDGETRIHLVKAPPAGVGARPAAAEATVPAGDLVVVAPVTGIFHASPAPDADPFVAEGQAVATGDTLCLIEAMKVFNAVEAEAAGTITAILATSGSEVAAGEPLFRLARPAGR